MAFNQKTSNTLFSVQILLLVSIFVVGASEHLLSKSTIWGQNGHRIVVQIAYNHLSDQARTHVDELLGRETMAEASTWADYARGTDEYRYTSPWHYTTIPGSERYEDVEKNPDGDVITALRKYEDILRDETASTEEKRIALKFYIHFAGDIHQPMHVGNGTDRGGNDFDVRWFDDKTNLHSVWDSKVIEHTQLSFTEFTSFIDDATPELIEKWTTDDTYISWAEESQQFRIQSYTYLEDQGNTDELPRLGWGFSNEFLPVIENRLRHAGYRLADRLNDIFGG